MAITRVTTTGWGSRIKSSLGGFVLGPLLILAAFPVLFKNEGCAVQMYKSLNEVKGKVVSVPSDKVNTANEGKLVHMSGKAVTTDVLADPAFGVSATAVKLTREVEMYQVRQNQSTKTEKQTGGKEVKTTTYTYENVWSSSFIDSSGFEEKEQRGLNPPMKYKGADFVAANVTLGAFKLSADQIGRLSGGEDLPVPNTALQKLAEPERKRAKVADGTLYIAKAPGGGPEQPQIGDLRISYRVVKPGDVSLIAQQQGNTFVPFKAAAGNAISLLTAGTLGPEQMVANAESAEGVRTWIVRALGFLMILIGFNLLFKPLSVVADVLPLLGSVVGFGGFVVSLMLAMALSFTTIAVAWIFYRPLLSIPLLIIAVGGLVFIIMRGRKTSAAPASA